MNADLVWQFHLSTIGKEADLRSRRIRISIDSGDQVVHANRPTFSNMAEQGDVEANPDAVNYYQNETTKNEIIKSETFKERCLRSLPRWKSTAIRKDPGPPPDGGIVAWTQAVVGHLIIMNTW